MMIIIYFQLHFDRNPFHLFMQREKKSLNNFKIGTFTGRFPSDGAASMAVKGLRTIHDAQRSGALGALLCNYGDSGKEVQCFVPNLFIYMPDISGH